MLRFFVPLLTCVSLLEVAYAASRTSPPAGAKVVRAGTTNSGEFQTVSAAVASLPSDSSSQAIFIYPGTYTEQVFISRSGPLTVRFFPFKFTRKNVYSFSRSMATRPTLLIIKTIK